MSIVIKDKTLNRDSPVADVLECMHAAITNLSDNEYFYADDEEGTNIHESEVLKIINNLRREEDTGK